MSFDLNPERESDQCLVYALTGRAGGDGDGGSRTLSAQPDGVDGEPQVEAPEMQKRKAPLIGGDDQ
jgi:hypothetical protein